MGHDPPPNPLAAGGTCAYDDQTGNSTVSNSRIAFQSEGGVYAPIGIILAADYLAWQGGRAVVLGDERPNVAARSV